MVVKEMVEGIAVSGVTPPMVVFAGKATVLVAVRFVVVSIPEVLNVPAYTFVPLKVFVLIDVVELVNTLAGICEAPSIVLVVMTLDGREYNGVFPPIVVVPIKF